MFNVFKPVQVDLNRSLYSRKPILEKEKPEKETHFKGFTILSKKKNNVKMDFLERAATPKFQFIQKSKPKLPFELKRLKAR